MGKMAIISQINGNEVVGKEFYEYVRTEGTVLFSFNPDFSPAALYGGSWEKITDRFLIGAGGSYPLGSTGGSATHTHDAFGYTHFVINPSDRMSVEIIEKPGGAWGANYTNDNTGWYATPSAWGYGRCVSTEVDVDSANNFPSYIAVNIWRRVA